MDWLCPHEQSYSPIELLPEQLQAVFQCVFLKLGGVKAVPESTMRAVTVIVVPIAVATDAHGVHVGLGVKTHVYTPPPCVSIR